MKTKTLIAALALAIATPALAQPIEIEIDTGHIPMRVGQTVVVRAPASFRTLAIAMPEIADAEALTDRQIRISAKKEGLSSILMSTEDGQAVAMVDVEVVMPHTYNRKRISVWYPDKPHKTYWCTGPGLGCEPDPANEEREMKSEMTFILPSPQNGGIGKQDLSIRAPRY